MRKTLDTGCHYLRLGRRDIVIDHLIRRDKITLSATSSSSDRKRSRQLQRKAEFLSLTARDAVAAWFNTRSPVIVADFYLIYANTAQRFLLGKGCLHARWYTKDAFFMNMNIYPSLISLTVSVDVKHHVYSTSLL